MGCPGVKINMAAVSVKVKRSIVAQSHLTYVQRYLWFNIVFLLVLDFCVVYEHTFGLEMNICCWQNLTRTTNWKNRQLTVFSLLRV